MKTNWRPAIFIILAALPWSCEKQLEFIYTSDKTLYTSLMEYVPNYPATKFFVIPDIHIYNKSLGVSGTEFANYIAYDRKLLAESEDIFKSVVEKVIQSNADFVLHPGDMTKDGEKASYRLLIPYLNRVKERGIKVYVVPGNHDVLNGYAYRFFGDRKQRVESITPEEFKNLFAEFGYKEAIYQDPHSLSYVAEPCKGLWLLALDSCRYIENQPGKQPVTDGKFSPLTLQWLEAVLIQSIRERKAVIAMFHHLLMEHYKEQDKYYGQFIIDNYKSLSRLFAVYNVRVVFTAHNHANDITCQRYEHSKFVFDVETGSLVTYPCAFRFVSIDSAANMIIKLLYVEQIESHAGNFRDYARAFSSSGIEGVITKAMKNLGIAEQEVALLIPQIAAAFLAHYQGNEKRYHKRQVINEEGLSLLTRFLVNLRKPLIEGLWTDLPPYEDRNISIDLKTGNWAKLE